MTQTPITATTLTTNTMEELNTAAWKQEIREIWDNEGFLLQRHQKFTKVINNMENNWLRMFS